METIEQYLPHHPFFAGMKHHLVMEVAQCSRRLEVPGGKPLFYQGDHADAMYVIRSGRMDLRVHRRSGRGMTVDTVEAGDVVGWSWLVPPHRWMFDAFALQDTDVIVLEGGQLKQKCETDPALGYAFYARVAQVMHQRLEAARARLVEQHEGFHGHLH